jgi:hypothetical protein
MDNVISLRVVNRKVHCGGDYPENTLTIKKDNTLMELQGIKI